LIEVFNFVNKSLARNSCTNLYVMWIKSTNLMIHKFHESWIPIYFSYCKTLLFIWPVNAAYQNVPMKYPHLTYLDTIANESKTWLWTIWNEESNPTPYYTNTLVSNAVNWSWFMYYFKLLQWGITFVFVNVISSATGLEGLGIQFPIHNNHHWAYDIRRRSTESVMAICFLLIWVICISVELFLWISRL